MSDANGFNQIPNVSWPNWLIEFDKEGNLTQPDDMQALLNHLQQHHYSDIIIASHGWNNDRNDAVSLYQQILLSLAGNISAFMSANRPDLLFIGILWPSIWLKENDHDSLVPDGLASAYSDAGLPAENLTTVTRLLKQPQLAEDDLTQLSASLSPMVAGFSDREGNQGHSDLMADDVHQLFSAFKISETINLLSLYTMKSRAGLVGNGGVARLLDQVVKAAAPSRIHLAGHSFGCKVLLSALCSVTFSGKVDSVLLLQPAISYLSFASKLPDQDRSGAYAVAPASRVKKAIYTTFSSLDNPLHTLYQLALRRQNDIGQRVIPGQPPSVFCSMGGYGPREAEQVLVHALPEPGQHFAEETQDAKLYAFDGSANQIKEHSDVKSPLVIWLLCLLLESD